MVWPAIHATSSAVPIRQDRPSLSTSTGAIASGGRLVEDDGATPGTARHPGPPGGGEVGLTGPVSSTRMSGAVDNPVCFSASGHGAVRFPTGRPFHDEMWAVLRTNPRCVCEGNVAVVGSKTERQAARALVAAYHEARLADLIEHVAEELDRYRAGEVDAYAVDETIHQYHRAAQELWKFCWSGGVGANTEIVARTLEQLTEAGETVDWWERIPSHRPRRR